ncbi:MAG: RDD family protein [Luteolibacter sp.]|uniref:RDD family protein n=1 Tax=Luteolibacter sp. TaxID=1962973 RepID=UPI003264409A
MEIWIILDGEKIGPLHDFEIRRKITTGELPASTPAWHEGSGDWKPLIEIDLFKREFELVSPPEENPFTPPAVDSPPENGNDPSLPTPQACGRRFWARWLDLSLYSGVWWLGMWAAGQNIEAATINPWIMFFHYVPWFALEAVLIHQYATTPGKWLLGLRVLNNDSSRLDLGDSTRRSMRVLFTGIGFGFSYLAFFCQLLSLFMVKRTGSTLWDQSGGHRVIASPLHPVRVMACVFAYFVAMMMMFGVFSPYIVKETIRRNPEYKEYFEKNPPWGLPPRN